MSSSASISSTIEAPASATASLQSEENAPVSSFIPSVSPIATEYITLEEAMYVTGFYFRHVKNLAKQVGITRIGRNAFDRQEFFQYWKYRTIIENEPKLPFESADQRQERINRTWKKSST